MNEKQFSWLTAITCTMAVGVTGKMAQDNFHSLAANRFLLNALEIKQER